MAFIVILNAGVDWRLPEFWNLANAFLIISTKTNLKIDNAAIDVPFLSENGTVFRAFADFTTSNTSRASITNWREPRKLPGFSLAEGARVRLSGASMEALPADYHMHTPLCKHAEGAPEAYARKALELGLPEIGFSDHSPLPRYHDDWRMLDEEFPTYVRWIQEARSKVPELPIRLGLEVDYFENGLDWIHQLSTRAHWDYLIGSVHYLGDWAMDDPSQVHRFRGRPVAEIWERYWALFGQAARSGMFDIMAHPDLVKKFGHRPPGDLRSYYEPAIQAVVDAGVAIEINTAGLFKEVAEMYPAREFLEMAAQARVPLVISSDAHAPEHVGREFAAAADLARACGFSRLCRFHERKRRQIAF